MITEKDDAFEVLDNDLVVSTCRRDPWSWRLELHSPDVTWTLTIGGAFSIMQSTVDKSAATTEAVADLLGQSVVAMRARKADSELEVRFGDGWVLTVEPDADYEAWEMYSTRGERLIAVPGDGVAKWGEIHR
ncbi:MAG TPA: DUF6188 family protein [Thermoanaerobaculia bacterium]|nr:DUF6188 family protein [Thermoanaerobaculia bacterium]